MKKHPITKLPVRHKNKTTNYSISKRDEKKELEYFLSGKPMEHEAYLGERGDKE